MPRKILIDVSHPAHVHFFKHFLAACDRRNVPTKVVARDKEITTDLLTHYDIDHEVIYEDEDETPIGATGQLRYTYELFKRCVTFSPDVIASIGGTAASFVSSVTPAKSVVFADSEAAQLQNKITMPLADEVYTPRSYDEDYGRKHVQYDGYHELAYLHPNRFDPDLQALADRGVNVTEQYFVVRFIAWGAQHDVGHYGLSFEQKRELVDELSSRGDVYITAESELPAEFEPYRLPVTPHLMHDLLAAANLYVGDSQTMATEAAVLGTPAIRSNSFAGADDMSNFVELEDEYDLLYSTPDGNEAIRRAVEWAETDALDDRWAEKRAALLEDKIDVTTFIIKELLDATEAS